MKKEQFIEKVKRQALYVGVMDAYWLINLYTEEFGPCVKSFDSVEDELVYSWIKLLEGAPKGKVCNICKTWREYTEFHIHRNHKDNRQNYCKYCYKDLALMRKRKKMEKNDF